MNNSIRIQHLLINFDDASVSSYGANIKIDNMAIAVLKILIENQGKTVHNESIMESVWINKPSSPEVIPAAISRLRKMFKKTGVGDNLITTVHKVGYRLDLPETQPSSEQSPVNIGIYTNKRMIWIAVSVLLIVAISLYAYNDKIYNINHTPVAENISDIKIDDHNIDDLNIDKPKNQFTQLYILRHTEKESNDSEDPALSDKGIQHAAYWKKVLQYIKFDEVYTTDFKRNVQTAKIVIGNDHYPLKFYYPMSFDVVQFLNTVKGETVLIIGHSNTIPDMVNRLIGNSQYPPMSHKNYNQLYQVIIGETGQINSTLLHIEMPD